MPAITLEPLMAALDDTDPVVQGNAARALGQMGTAAAPALERLVKLLLPKKLNQPLESARAVEAIGLIGPGLSEERWTAFETAHAQHLAGGDHYNRLMVLNASVELGWPIDRLETTASALLSAPQNWQVWETVDVLAKLAPRPVWATTLLEEAAQHPNGLVRAKARRALLGR
jgi:HEAT repeat protein